MDPKAADLRASENPSCSSKILELGTLQRFKNQGVAIEERSHKITRD
jgi:hypothetical protein